MRKPKWTEEAVKEHLMNIMNHALKPEVLYLGHALFKEGLYTEIWSYWKRLFADNEEMMVAMKRIDTAFEVKLYEGALSRELSPWMACFGLKYCHRWSADHDHAGDTQQEIKPLPDKSRPDTNFRAYLTGGRVLLIGDTPEEGGIYKKVEDVPEEMPGDDEIIKID